METFPGAVSRRTEVIRTTEKPDAKMMAIVRPMISRGTRRLKTFTWDRPFIRFQIISSSSVKLVVLIPPPVEPGEAPMNIVFSGAPVGSLQTVDQMIASTERGILVTRLWYIREVDPYEKNLTGMTRDGTFLVEHGRVQCGIRNLRFNQSLIHMLRNVEVLGRAVRASGEESIDMVVPPMKVGGFNFTEITRF